MSRGFSLVEMMIVVALIGILGSIVYPSYVKHVAQAGRSDALGVLVDYASKQEQYFTDHREYATSFKAFGESSDTKTSEHELYKFSFSTTDKTANFTLTAVAQSVQASRDTDCASISIDYLGQKTAKSGSGSDSSNTCWSK